MVSAETLGSSQCAQPIEHGDVPIVIRRRGGRQNWARPRWTARNSPERLPRRFWFTVSTTSTFNPGQDAVPCSEVSSRPKTAEVLRHLAEKAGWSRVRSWIQAGSRATFRNRRPRQPVHDEMRRALGEDGCYCCRPCRSAPIWLRELSGWKIPGYWHLCPRAWAQITGRDHAYWC